ncbi:MAG TPA: VOC family protein [Acidimicrobiales bacterium]|jgi:hypothetical protein|nr:VOC family protein [Acidimicrobiales bacterium]
MGIRIGNVVFDAPGPTIEEYGRSAGSIARLYAGLLDMDLLSRGDHYRSLGYPANEGDDVDPLVRSTTPGQPDFAFEQESGTYRPPRWPDPDHPQQLHLDIVVPDLAAARQGIIELGGTLLREADGHCVLADPVGHPLCLYAGAAGEAPRVDRIVFDCFSPRALAAFYSVLFESDAVEVDTPELVVLDAPRPGAPKLAFQHTLHQPPRWPDPAHPQQVHIDLASDDPYEAALARERALRAGAVALPYLGGGQVLADPSGHPFCVCD